MSAQAAPLAPRLHRALLFVLYLIAGAALFLFGANTIRVFPTNRNAVYEWGLTLLFLAVALALRWSPRLTRYWRVALSLCIASFANALNLALGNWLRPLLPPATSTMHALAIDKLSQVIPMVAAMIILTLLSGERLGDIFLQKGDLRAGLRFGLISFGAFALLFAAIAVWQASGPAGTGLFASGVGLPTLVAALPWILIFVLANGLFEELWFRGLSLGKLTPLLGRGAAVVLTALVFSYVHAAAEYISPWQRFLFPAVVFGLGLLNGYTILRTRGIWGSALFHAGYDLLVIIPLLAGEA